MVPSKTIMVFCVISSATVLAPSAASVTSTDQTLNASTVRVFYLATDPGLFGPISENLGQADLVTRESRVVLEKPIGHDLASSRAVNDAVGAVFGENQIFRIDHYLGKEAVQNLLALRFANALLNRFGTPAGLTISRLLSPRR